MPNKPHAQLSTTLNGLGVTTNSALVILSLVIEATSDIFPPLLKPAAAAALSIVDGVKTFRLNKEGWAEFGDLVAQEIAFLADKLNGNQTRLSPTLLKDLETLSKKLHVIHEKIVKAQNRSIWRKIGFLKEDPSLLSALKEKLNDALSHFSLASHIDVRIHQQHEDKQPMYLSSTTPPAPLFFYGRDEYLLDLVRRIKAGQERASASHIITHGPGGIGKTSIVIALIHHRDVKSLFSDHVYFASCEAALSETLFLEVIAFSLGLQKASNSILSSIVTFIREASCPVLLVLDNFETCWLGEHRHEIHEILKHLVSLEKLTLVLTMRGKDQPHQIRWEQVSEVSVLSLEDARRLFVDISETDTSSDPLVDELLQAFDCLPLAIILLAQLVRQGESIKTLHRRWTVQKTGLLSVTTDENRHYSLDASIKVSLNSTPMNRDPCATRLLRVLSYLPDGIPSGGLEALGLFSVKEAYQASFTLRSVSLAYQDSKGSLRSLSPIRRHVAHYTPLKDGDLKTVQDHYIDLAEIAGEALVKGMASGSFLRPELGNLFSVLRDMACSTVVEERTSSAILKTSKFMYSYDSPTPDLLQLVLENKHFMPSAHYKAEGIFLIGMVHHVTTKYALALKTLEEARNLLTCLSDWRRVGICESVMAAIHKIQGKLSDAVVMFEKAKNALERLEAKDTRVEKAYCLWGLAGIGLVRGELEKSRSMLEDGIKLLSGTDHSLLLTFKMDLAIVSIEQGNYKKAVDALHLILEECKVREDHYSASRCLSILCDALLPLGEYDQARKNAEEGRIIAKMHDNAEVRAICSRALGYVCLHREAFSDAEVLFTEALSTFKQNENRIDVLDTELAIAKLSIHRGDINSAQQSLLAILSGYREMECLRGIASVELTLSSEFSPDPVGSNEAIDRAQKALKIYKSFNNLTQIEECQSLLSTLKLPTEPIKVVQAGS